MLAVLKRAKRYIAALWFMVLSVLLISLSCFSIITAQKNNMLPSDTYRGWMRGAVTQHAETWFDAQFIGQDVATAIWGALRYGMFNTGNDGVVIGNNGWLFTREEFDIPHNASELEAAKLANIYEMKKALLMHGAELLVVMLPSKARLYETSLPQAKQLPSYKQGAYDRVLNALERKGIAHIDARSVLMKRKRDAAYFFQTDTHWTPNGARLVAKLVASYIKGNYPDLPFASSTYVTHNLSLKRHDGDLVSFVPMGFFAPLSSIRPELYTAYETTGEAGAHGLFSTIDIPYTLVGTSYSAMNTWNFEGFLKEAIGADILNVSDEGEGPFVPMRRYLMSLDAGAAAPRMVIWEIPERFFHMHDITAEAEK